MRAAIIAWGRARWPGVRVIHELACGERRTDLVFVCDRDIVCFEIKSSVDRLDRLAPQLKEYQRFFPEVWAALAPCWEEDGLRDIPNRMTVDGAGGTVRVHGRRLRPFRDELVCSRLLELLWVSEAQTIAQRTGVIPGTPTRQLAGKTKKMLARLLTGNQIIAEVCRELRARQLVGRGSDAPMRTVDAPMRTS